MSLKDCFRGFVLTKPFITKFIVSIFLLIISNTSSGQKNKYDLIILNAAVFDSKKGEVQKNKTILIKDGIIINVSDSKNGVTAKRVIDAKGKLVTPGFIDTHTHLRNVYGTIEDFEKDTAGLVREKLSSTYLKYGTTTIVDMGQPEKWMETTLAWQKQPLPGFPNIFISGGAMVSEEPGRKTYMNHVVVKSPEDAKAKVQTYAKEGLKHIKIYWRLRTPEMQAAVLEGKKQNLTISAHIDNNVTSIWEAINLGVKNFEHMLSLPPAVINLEDHYGLVKAKYGYDNTKSVDKFLAQILFLFDYIKEDKDRDAKLEALLDKMAQNGNTLSTAIHIMGSVAGKTYFTTSLSNKDSIDLSGFTRANKEQLSKAFDIMMHYLKKAHNKGVKIRIGTDCRDGGKALLSELLLLHEANFSIADILKIATINGAEAMNINDKYGSIEKGKKADLLIFDKNPFENYKNFLAEKIVIKDGVPY